MNTQLIVVANANRVNIFTDNHKKNMELTTFLEHPENRQKTHELVSDRPGHYKTGGTSRGAYSLRTTPKETEKIKFAMKVANLIETEINSTHCHNLILIADPQFYGLLKKHFNKVINNSIQLVIKKNLNGVDKSQLKSFIMENRFAS